MALSQTKILLSICAYEQQRDRMFEDFLTVDLVLIEKTHDRQIEIRHLRHYANGTIKAS